MTVATCVTRSFRMFGACFHNVPQTSAASPPRAPGALSMAGKTAYSTLGVEDFVAKVSNLDEIEE